MDNKNYTWDLDSLLNGKTLDELYSEWVNSENEVYSIYPNFYKTKENFEHWLDVNEKNEIISNHLMNYISNNLQEDLVNPKWLGYVQKIRLFSNEMSVKMSGYLNLVLEHKKEIQEYLKDPKLSEHVRDFELQFKHEKHVLDPKIEEALSKASAADGAVDQIFSTLTDSDIKFKDALNSKNESIKLKTIGDIHNYLKNEDRTLRKNVWINFHSAYDQYANTLSQTLYYNYLKLNTNAKIHNFEDYVSASAYSDEIDVSFITTLYEQVQKFKDIHTKYRNALDNLLKKQLNIEKVEPWDRSVDLCQKQINVTIEQTQEIVLEALRPLGEEYCSQIKRAFDERWISWLPKENKMSGAYSIGGIKGLSKFFINMNFDGTMNSVETVAHELGHSMNSYYSVKNQKVNPETCIFYAEIASITTETLLTLYLLNKYKDDKTIVNMYIKLLMDNFFACTTRQIEFSNFEFEANKMVNNGISFNAESCKQLYVDMLKKYENISPEAEEKFKLEPYKHYLSTILRIPHFYSGNFYVYKYAIGQICGLIVANKIFNGDTKMKDDFIKFLSSGSSLSPLDTIKLLGIDLTTSQPYEQVINIINELLEKF